MRKLVAAVAVLSAFVLAPVAQAQPVQHEGPTVEPCKDLKGDAYGVCTAYYIDDALTALMGYYVNGAYPPKAHEAEQNLAARYQGEALQAIKDRVASWPVLDPVLPQTVRPPNMSILHVDINLRCGTAVMVTQENWLVKPNFDHIYFIEEVDPHTILLRRLPGERFQLGKRWMRAWAVYKIYDKEMDIKPTCN